MFNRRALIVAPLYDGKMFRPLAGRPLLVQRLTKCLSEYGKYDVRALDGSVEQPKFRETIHNFFETDGDLLFYFYGHGYLRHPGLGVFVTSDASIYNEGILMDEVTALAHSSKAREAVFILDCCHAGAANPVTVSTFLAMATQVILKDGRGIIAACASHQQGWEVPNNDGQLLGAFSTHVLDGLEGAACGPRSNQVRASTLGSYVTGIFSKWNQDPISRTSETGTHLSVITVVPSKAPPKLDITSEERKPLIIGLPFKPSQIFEGRAAEIDSLLTMLIDGHKPIAVSATVEGLGGIGKTELVIQLLHHPDILRTYDTIIWFDGACPLPSQWEKVAPDLDMKIPAQRPVDLIQRIERELRKRGNTLIILDNATEWDSVHDFIPQGISLLITTITEGFGGNSFRHLDLRPLSEDAAVRFLIQMVPELENDSSLPRLVERLDGHALALELAGWNIKYQGLNAAEYIKHLDMSQGDSPRALSATRYGRPVDGCLTLTWNALRQESSRALWRRASLFAPTSAHRELLRVSFVGDQKTHDDIEWIRGELSRVKDSDALKMYTSEVFNEAYTELRTLHVLSRVEGFNGERWAMHRLVRNYGGYRLQSGEVMVHVMALAEWLRQPTLPLLPEVPHLVATVLVAVKHAGEFPVLGKERYPLRDTSVRGLSPRGNLSRGRSTPLFDPEAFLSFFQYELRDPKALTMILEGLTDNNEAVRIQAIELLESIGPISEVLESLAASLADPDSRVRELARNTLAKYGSEKTINILRATVGGANRQAGLEATRTLGLMGTKAYDALKDVLSNDDLPICTEAALLLCEGEQKEGIGVLIEAIQSVSGLQSSKTIVRAVHALGKTKEKHLYPNLLELLKQDNDDIRCAAAESIEELEIPNGPATIVAFLVTDASEKQLHGRFPYKVLEIAAKHNITIPEILRKYPW